MEGGIRSILTQPHRTGACNRGLGPDARERGVGEK